MTLPILPLHFGSRATEDLTIGCRPERRRRARTQVHWPVKLFSTPAGESVETITRDLSSEGFYCVSVVRPASGEPIHCMLTLPTHDQAGHRLVLHCRIRVLRVEPVDGDRFGMACRIEDYHPIPTETTPA